MRFNRKYICVNVVAALLLLLGRPAKIEAQVQERFGLTPAQFQSAFNDFFKQGYRLKSMSGYTSGGAELYAALWIKVSGPAWQARFGLSGADFQKTFDSLFKQGYRLTWISAHEAGGEPRFEGIWEKISGPAWEAKYGMNAAQYQQNFDDFKKKGFRLVHVYGYAVGGSAQYAAIWEKSNGPALEARHGLSSAQFQQAFDDFVKQGYVLKVVSGYHADGQDEYAAIWEKTAGPYWMARNGVPEDRYQHIFDNYYYQGYLPLMVTAFASDGAARLNTIWTNTNFKAADLDTIQKEMDEALRAAHIAGLSIAVARKGQLVYAAGFGEADKENNIEMSVDHKLRIGSISKSITSVAIFRMMEANTKLPNGQPLSLNSRVFGNGGILGDKIAVPALLEGLKKATIQDFLQHTSGLPDTGDPTNCSAGDLNKRIQFVLDQVQPVQADPSKNIPPVPRDPGTAFTYSNLNFIILQSVIETLSGEPYEKYVSQHVFAPTHIINASLFKIGPYDPASGEAKHYTVDGSYAEYSPDNTCDMKPPGVGAGGWAMSAKDLLHYLSSVDGLAPADIVTSNDHTKMTTGSKSNADYGDGWQVGGWGSCNASWAIAQGHNGGLSGAFSDLYLMPNGMSFALIANQDATKNGFCTPVPKPGAPSQAKVACGGDKQPVCADEPLSRIVELLGKVTWPDYNLFQ